MSKNNLIDKIAKIIIVVGVAISTIFILKNILLIGGMLSLLVFGLYHKTIYWIIDSFLSNFVRKHFPEYALEKYIRDLTLAKNKLDEKAVNISGQLEQTKLKINKIRSKDDSRFENAIKIYSKTEDILKTNYDRAKKLSENIEAKKVLLQSEYESRREELEVTKDAIKMAKDSKKLLNMRDDNNDKEILFSIDHLLAGMNGELNELLKQAQEELK